MILFEPVREIRAGETLTFRVPCEVTLEGIIRVYAELRSEGLEKPLAVVEKTEILGR